MMRKLTLLLVAVFGMVFSSQAQYCGFDAKHNQLLSSSPAFAQKVNNMNSQLAALLASSSNSLIVNTANGPVYEIPVVIHVIHTGGAIGTIYNPTDATLQGMISYLNQTYAATYASYPNASSGGTYFPVQFALAKRDPNCNTSSTGINRVNGSGLSGYSTYGVMHNGTLGASETSVKALSVWDHNDYYNVWVVNKIDGLDGTSGTFTAGYAYFPGAGPSLDGTIMLATQAVAGSITLPHEIGHAFGLYHVFEGDDPGHTGSATTCPPNTSCTTQGDLVCDTEPMERSLFICPSGTNPCTGAAWLNTQHNFMDYSSCQDRFTTGQKTRWINTLTTVRPSLISSLGATTLGTPPTAANCFPSINNPFYTGDEGVYEVRLNDMVGTTDGGYNSDGAAVYLDKSCHQRANLQAGSSYPISVQTGPSRSKVRVYIDYNNDGVFNAATELVYSHDGSTGTAGFNEVHTGTIAIPSSGITTCAAIRMRVVADFYTPTSVISPCGNLDYGQAEDYSVVIRAAPTSVVTVTQTTGTNPSCNGSTIGFTASYTGSPTTPSVKWYVGGVYTGTTGTTYTTSSIANGAIVTAKLFYVGTCGADSTTSAGFTVSRAATVTPTVNIVVSAGSNPGCLGQAISFTATPTNGGSGPVYAWKVNGTAVTGATTSTYTTTTLPCTSTVQAVLTSNSACATVPTVNSNTINYTCGPQTVSVAVAVTGGSNPTCANRNVSFSATPTNGGSSPTYQWYVNGAAITGATNSTFSSSTLNNGDSVRVLLTSSSTCAATGTVYSPAVYMVVVPNVTPSVTKAITIGSNPGCINDLIEFTATTANAGLAPTYRWFLNGNPLSTASNYTNTTAVTGDKVWVRIIASNATSSCYTNDTAYSDTTTLVRLPVPNLPVISFINGMLVSDSGNVQWYGPAGLLPGALGGTYHPTVQGTYYAQILNPLCGGGMSNILTVSPLSIGTYNMAGVKVYPNPTTGMLTINWSAASTTRITVYTPAGQTVMNDVATVTTRKVLDMSNLANGVYFVVLQDESGKTGAVRVTVTH